ncbi:hypothetical protein [Urbifossiella limnaea]|uniref:Uncharacterized protein n=1 Tax=Urbifossiella limnaea TaxID=2528023 RepID=A0A517Y0X7_9BACT|nr:hypothetical protein [Urbifossiella limnaea]QDU23416.1 hypothetical protein ETAA1_54160 [Urbifossiella limnaea]
MAVPTGEVVARPMVARACGCMREFQHYKVDKYRAQRLAKFQGTRCEDCVAKLNEQQKQAAAQLPKKGEAFQALPTGTQLALSRLPDGTWGGSLTAEGRSVTGTGESPHGLTIALARQWVLEARGPGEAPKPTAAAPSPKPPAAPKPLPAGVRKP